MKGWNKKSTNYPTMPRTAVRAGRALQRKSTSEQAMDEGQEVADEGNPALLPIFVGVGATASVI